MKSSAFLNYWGHVLELPPSLRLWLEHTDSRVPAWATDTARCHKLAGESMRLVMNERSPELTCYRTTIETMIRSQTHASQSLHRSVYLTLSLALGFSLCLSFSLYNFSPFLPPYMSLPHYRLRLPTTAHTSKQGLMCL